MAGKSYSRPVVQIQNIFTATTQNSPPLIFQGRGILMLGEDYCSEPDDQRIPTENVGL
jgi:hypothetical protein